MKRKKQQLRDDEVRVIKIGEEALFEFIYEKFIDEQVEEEESAREMIATFEAVEGNKYGMYMLDKELAARTYVAPSPLAAE